MKFHQMPSVVWPHVNRLSGLQLAIYCDAWTWQQQGKDNHCSNATLALMYQVSERSIPRAVAKLVELGLVTIEQRPDGLRTITCLTPDQPVTPDRPVTPDQPVKGGVTNLSGGDDRPVRGGDDQPVTQLYHKTISSTITSTRTNARAREVIWPFDSDQFMNAWKEWEADRRERRVKPYTTRGLQTALHRLQQISEYNEGIAIRIITQSIANGWQGLFPLDNKRGNHQHDRPRGKDITADDLARLVAKRYGPRFPPANQ